MEIKLFVMLDLFQMEYEDSGSEFCDGDCLGKGDSVLVGRYGAGRLDLSEIFFSNEEYYSKLEELKKAHLRTMAELESLYRRKLQLRTGERLDTAALEAGQRWEAGQKLLLCQRVEASWISCY